MFHQISYDLSQRLISADPAPVIRLSNNSWICSCESQITDKVMFIIEHFIKRYQSSIMAVNRYLITLDDDFTQKSFQNLMAKLQDKAYMKCGEKSAVKFRSKKVKKIISSATS